MTISEVIEELVTKLRDAGLYATGDPNEFYPAPIGCLVGVPSLRMRGLGNYLCTVPVHVVCTQALSAELRNELFESALVAADVLGVESFNLDGWNGGVNEGDLPAYLLEAVVQYS